jgi:hypothetical protein
MVLLGAVGAGSRTDAARAGGLPANGTRLRWFAPPDTSREAAPLFHA